MVLVVVADDLAFRVWRREDGNGEAGWGCGSGGRALSRERVSRGRVTRHGRKGPKYKVKLSFISAFPRSFFPPTTIQRHPQQLL